MTEQELLQKAFKLGEIYEKRFISLFTESLKLAKKKEKTGETEQTKQKEAELSKGFEELDEYYRQELEKIAEQYSNGYIEES